jgi:hypothetical protein
LKAAEFNRFSQAPASLKEMDGRSTNVIFWKMDFYFPYTNCMYNLCILPRGLDRFLIAFLLLLPAVPVAAQEQPMVITYGVGGGWFEPATNGQGLVFEVIPATNLMVAYWFTYPQNGGSREWFLAQGDISGARADLVIYQASGGIFDLPSEVTLDEWGTSVLEFSSCTVATWAYESSGGDVSGDIPLQRIGPDVLCASEQSTAMINVVSRTNAWFDLTGTWVFDGCVSLENNDSHGTERFTFSEDTLHFTMDHYPNTSCEGVPEVREFNFRSTRVDKTTASLEGEQVIANRMVFIDPVTTEQTKMILYIDDREIEPLFAHGLQDSPPDIDGFPTELPALFFIREQ